MKQFLSIVGPLVANFIAWSFITWLPVHSTVIFALVIISGVLMMYAMIRLREKVDKGSSTQK